MTASAVADVMQMLMTPEEIEQLRRKCEQEKSAVADVIAHKAQNGKVPLSVMIGIAASNGLHPKKLTQLLEEGQHIRPGALARLEASFPDGETWDSLTKKVIQGGENDK